MFKVTHNLVSALYTPDILPQPAKGVVLFDVDNTFAWSREPPLLWSNSPDYQGDYDWGFQYGHGDIYIPAKQNRAVLARHPLGAKLVDSLTGWEMHAFKIKRRGKSYFIATFVADGSVPGGQYLPGEWVYIRPQDIVIPSPDYLMMTCYLLLLNGYFVELATQRLVMFDGQKTSTENGVKANKMTAMLLWSLNVCFRPRRQFFRHDFSLAVAETFLQKGVKGVLDFESAQSESKTNLVALILEVGSRAGYLKAPQKNVILVDDNIGYKDTTEGLTHFVAANNLLRRDPYRHLRELLKQCKITPKTIFSYIAVLKIQASNGGSDLDEALITDFTHDVLRQLTQDEHLLKSAANTFSGVLVGPDSPVYAIAANGRGIMYAKKDIFCVWINLAPRKKYINEGPPRVFCLTSSADDSYILAGRKLKKGAKSDSYLALINSQGTQVSHSYLPNDGTIVSLAQMGDMDKRHVVTLSTCHDKGKTVCFSRYYIAQRDRVDQFKLTVNYEDKDSINRNLFHVCAYLGPSEGKLRKVACVTAYPVAYIMSGDMGRPHYQKAQTGAPTSLGSSAHGGGELALRCIVYSLNEKGERIDHRLRFYGLPKVLRVEHDKPSLVKSFFLNETKLILVYVFDFYLLKVYVANDVWIQTSSTSAVSQVKEVSLLGETRSHMNQLEPSKFKITSIAFLPDKNCFALAYVERKNLVQTYFQVYQLEEGLKSYRCTHSIPKGFGEITAMTWKKIADSYYLVCGSLKGIIQIVPISW